MNFVLGKDVRSIEKQIEMFKDFSDGILKYFQVFRLAREFNLWKYFYISGFLSFLAGALILYFAYLFGDNLGNSIFSWYKWDFGSKFIESIEDWVGGIIIAIFAVLIFKYVVLIVSAPIMSFLSEQLERQLTHYPPHSSFTLKQFLDDLVRGIIINLRNITRELLIVGVLLLLGLIPVFTIFIPILIFIVQSYYAGFGNLDYFLERHYKVRGSVRFVHNHRFLAIGNGAVFLVLLMVPVLGWFVAPFFGTIASTACAVPRLERAQK